jgi:hypothetical protein
VASYERVDVVEGARVRVGRAVARRHHRILRESERVVEGDGLVVDGRDDAFDVGELELAELEQGAHESRSPHVSVVVSGLIAGGRGAGLQQPFAEVVLERRHREPSRVAQRRDAHPLPLDPTDR